VDDDANQNTLDYAYIWDHSLNGGSGGYQIHYGEPKPPSVPGEDSFDGRIPAFQSFWVKAEEEGANLKLSAADFTANQSLYKQQRSSSYPYLKISVKGRGFTDGVSLMFPSGKAGALDPVPKLNSLSQKHAELYLTDNKNQRWIARNFMRDGAAQNWSVPFDIDITEGGIYSLSWDLETLPKNWKVTLIDNQTGEELNLRTNNFYDIDVQVEDQLKTKTLAEKLPVAPGSHPKTKAAQSRFTLHISTNVASDTQIPTQTNLYQNYPNPFNPTTNITYDVPEKSQVRLTFFDMLGRKVATLVNQEKAAGQYRLNFNGHDFASGTYIYRLQIGSKVMTKKMTLIK
jgi:hypothetical protein